MYVQAKKVHYKYLELRVTLRNINGLENKLLVSKQNIKDK